MRTVVPGPCPYCNNQIEYLYTTENIPHFSDILIISAICPSCGYKYVDTQMLKHGEPLRFTLEVGSEADLAARIIRSMSSSIEIPELGVRVDPGPACEGFVSNVEGVLDRIVKAVRSAVLQGTDEERENARILLENIDKVKNGTFPVTIIVEDPSGNSAIVSDKVKKESYVVEEEE